MYNLHTCKLLSDTWIVDDYQIRSKVPWLILAITRLAHVCRLRLKYLGLINTDAENVKTK